MIMIWLLFFFSGACALIYEVLWTQQLSLIFGNTVHSLSAVLTSFMAGLGLGSYVSGRLTSKILRPLRVYGILEILIGFYCALLPFLFGGAELLYQSIYNNYGNSFYFLSVARFVMSFVLLLIPTAFMGATLPILTQALVNRRRGLGFTAGNLYAFNTFGAVIGTLGAGFWLIPALGIQLTTLATAATNLLLGFGAISLEKKLDPETGTLLKLAKKLKTKVDLGKKPEKSTISPGAVRVSVVVFAVSGFAAMVSQVGWTRVLSLAIGSTIYAFTVILAAFILGLALGSAVFARISDGRKDLIWTVALVQLAAGAACALALPLLGWSPLLFVDVILKYSASFDLLLALEFLVIVGCLLIPTLLMGATFPLVAKIYYSSRNLAGRAVGDVYAVNTLGAILGAFCVGFILIPSLGIETSLMLAVGLFLASGLALFVMTPVRKNSRKVIAVAAVLTVTLSGSLVLGQNLQSWNKKTLSSGLYMLSHGSELEKIAEKGRLEEVVQASSYDLEYYKEGLTATVAVLDQNGHRFLKIGGKTDATNFGDMPTQLLLAHAPMLLHPRPKDVLVIGLGAGVTAGAALAYPSVEQLDLVEISPEVVEAVRDRRLFDDVNGRPFDDPQQRVNLIVTDARNYAELTRARYDVIISEPSNPWMAGMAMLFTKEHLENCRDLLNASGVMCQWLPAYRISKEDFLTVLATFASVFDQVSVWESLPGVDYLFVGSRASQRIDYERVTTLLEHADVGGSLKRILIRNLPTLLSYHLADDPQVRNLVAGYPVNTDDNVLLQYSAPRRLFDNSARAIAFNEIRLRSQLDFVMTSLATADRTALEEQISRARQGRAWTLRALQHRWRRELQPTLEALKRAVSLNSNDWYARHLEIEMRLDAVRNSLQLGRHQQAFERLQKIELLPGQPREQVDEYRMIASIGIK